MKLLYTWIEIYRNLENIGLNWNNEFKVELAEDKQTINIKKNDDYFNLFSEYTCIENFKVIVGKNGTGKTNILHLLGNGINNYSPDDPNYNDKFFNIYYLSSHRYVIEGNGREIISILINQENLFLNLAYCIEVEYDKFRKKFRYIKEFKQNKKSAFISYNNRLSLFDTPYNYGLSIKRFSFRRNENILSQKCRFIADINSKEETSKEYLKDIFNMKKDIFFLFLYLQLPLILN
ncbi:hypothetical protein PQ460_14030 [Paenibacillus sp. KACC 21273]|uniref:hypothetical protein n=1 Tax=Paenibacillus sp. KACC 21273 TaxID=3025665 RepID=UPI002365FE6E|nr:hypothetical protein [Paenibacillus sp. KACC 21273]WDF49131.1 hypothetical protein PQ460_14030 [Paenibacillus sp. KACC 21273]